MPNVLIEDKNMVIEFPDDMSADEIGNIIQKEVYGKDLESPKAKVKAGARAVGIGLIQPILSSPEHIGSLMQEFGETTSEDPTWVDRLSTISAGGIDPKTFMGVKKFILEKTGIDKFISNKSKQLIENNRKFMEANEINPGTGKVNEFLFALGSGVTSLAEALAITKLTGSPHAAAALFGAQAKAMKYQEARKAGKTPKEAQALSTVAGVAEGGLEYIGLDRFFKKQGTGIAKAVFRAFVEGSQEVSQELAGNIITKLGIDSTKNLMDGVIQSGVIGFLLGGGASVVMTPFEKQAIYKDLQDQGLTQEEAVKTVDFLEKETDRQSNVALNNIIEETKVELPEAKKVAPEAPTAPKTPIVEGEGKVEKPTVTETLEQRLDKLDTDKEKIDLAKNDLAALDEISKQFKGRIQKYEGDYLKEELTGFPSSYITKKGGISPDEAMEELRGMGVDIRDEVALKEYFQKLDAQKQKIKETIKSLRPETISKKEPTYIKQRLADIKRGIKEGTGYTLKQVKGIQNEMIEMISGLEAKDKAKFIKTIKNIQTPAQLTKAVDELISRIQRVQEQTKKAEIGVKIKKELTKTKPVKKGQRTVGKYDYESNKFFEEVRGYSKLNQAKAQEALDAMPTENLTQLDLIKTRILSLQANGASASLEIYQQVLNDIKTLKELGSAAKDDADFEKRLARNARVDETLISIDKIKANKKSVKTKIGNAYRRGFSNMYSMFNSIAGSKFAKQYDPELSENARNTAIYKKTTDVTAQASKIYDQKNIMKVFESMSTKDYTITDIKDGLTIELSKLELIDIYNSIKNTKKQEDYFEAYGQEQVETLLGNLTSKDMAFGDMLQESIQEYREVLNAHNIAHTGRDLGFVENYWPATSEYQVSVIDDMRVQGETPSAEKARAKGRVIPKPSNAWYKAGKHIAEAEHVKSVSGKHETLKRMFTDRKVKHAIEQKFGEKVYQTVMAQIDNISLNKQIEHIDAISSTFQKAINNWVTAKIALNPSTYVRQLMSVGNYMEQMNAAEWTAGFMEGILHPRQTVEFMWKNAPFLEARFKKGSTEAINEAIKGAESIGVNKSNYVKALTSLVRSGDITAIIFGGYPLAKTQGFKAFESATLKAQQSGLSSSLSQFQNSRNPFTRLFLAFKNTSNQYFRKQVDTIISYQNKDISAAQLAKTTIIYSVIQPIAYVSAGFATKEVAGAIGRAIFGADDDEYLEDKLNKLGNDIMTQLVVSPVNSIPLLNDMVKAAMRKATDQNIYQVISIPWLDDIERAMRKFLKEEVTLADYLEIAGSVLEPTTGLPAGTALRYYKTLTGNKLGEN